MYRIALIVLITALASGHTAGRPRAEVRNFYRKEQVFTC